MAKQNFIKASGIIYSNELKTICGVKGNNDGGVKEFRQLLHLIKQRFD